MPAMRIEMLSIYLTCAPCAELRYIHQSALTKVKASGWNNTDADRGRKPLANLGDRSIVGRTDKNVLSCARGDDGW